MSNHLELPAELQALIEKREGERRQQEANSAADTQEQLPEGEERRKRNRRATDKP